MEKNNSNLIPQAPAEQKRSNKYIWPGALIILIILAAGFIYFGTRIISPSIGPCIVGTDSPCNGEAWKNKPKDYSNTVNTQVDTSNWKTFANNEDSYTLQYPNKFTLGKNERISVNNAKTLFYSATFGFPNRLGSPGTIYTANTSLANAKKAVQGNNYKEISSETQKINGLDIVVIVMQNMSNKEDISNVAYITRKNDLLIFSLWQQYEEDFNNILSTIQITTASTVSPYSLFKGLTNWNEQNYSDWQLYNYTNQEEHLKQLKSYGTSKVTMLFKDFNNDVCMSDCSSERDAHSTLLTNIKKTLSQSGFKEVPWTNEPGFYTDYLYVKDGRPLVLLVGTRDAVKGGMYIGVEFFD